MTIPTCSFSGSPSTLHWTTRYLSQIGSACDQNTANSDGFDRRAAHCCVTKATTCHFLNCQGPRGGRAERRDKAAAGYETVIHTSMRRGKVGSRKASHHIEPQNSYRLCGHQAFRASLASPAPLALSLCASQNHQCGHDPHACGSCTAVHRCHSTYVGLFFSKRPQQHRGYWGRLCPPWAGPSPADRERPSLLFSQASGFSRTCW